MNVQQLVPEPTTTPAAEIAERLAQRSRQRVRPPFADDMMDFCASFSNALFSDAEAKRYPELQSLAFWMRKAELTRLKSEFHLLSRPDCALVPRGLVFHIPPANVDTMFVYSWLLAALAGNVNVIRLSRRRTPQVDALLRIFGALLNSPHHASLVQDTAVVTYGHDQEITREFSGRCDVRVVWGGDKTIATVRQTPIPPFAKELAFADRSSFSIIRVARYLELSAGQRRALAERFFNDTYWFDQMGCSSPRLLIWYGSRDDAAAASAMFAEALAWEVQRRRYEVDASGAMHKMTFAFRAALDLPVGRHVRFGNELTFMTLESAVGADRGHPGLGFFFEETVEQLQQVEEFVTRREQTATHFGLSEGELSSLALRLNGRGIDRFVPMGEALDFNRFWDGYDLLQEFCRRVVIKSQGRPLPSDGGRA